MRESGYVAHADRPFFCRGLSVDGQSRATRLPICLGGEQLPTQAPGEIALTPLQKTIAVSLGAVGLFFLMIGTRKRPPGTVRPPTDRSPGAVAAREAERWKENGLVETDPEAIGRIKAYWGATGLPFPGIEEPWSAAFISWAVRESENPESLTPSGAHIYYTRAAYYARGETNRYGAFRPSEVKLEPGDIVIRGRSGVPFDWSDVSAGAGEYIPTHGDLVTDASPSEATIVGGNVGNAVKARTIGLENGHAPAPYVAVLRIQREPIVA